jgi:hypothetical protein
MRYAHWQNSAYGRLLFEKNASFVPHNNWNVWNFISDNGNLTGWRKTGLIWQYAQVLKLLFLSEFSSVKIRAANLYRELIPCYIKGLLRSTPR